MEKKRTLSLLYCNGLSFFGITTELDCTLAYQEAKENDVSFFAIYLHKSMKAVNTVEELTYRIENDQVVAYPIVHAGATIGREDGTFGFIYVKFSTNFQIFNTNLQKEIEAVHNSSGLRLNNDDLKNDLIRHTTIPWTSFSSVLHPTRFNSKDSVPKLRSGNLAAEKKKIFTRFHRSASWFTRWIAHITIFSKVSRRVIPQFFLTNCLQMKLAKGILI